MDADRCIRYSLLLLVWLARAEWVSAQATPSPPNSFEAKVAELWRQLPPPQTHFEGVPEGDAENRRRSEKDYGAFLREKVQGQWFAALLSTEAGQSFSVQRRFESWKTLLDFLIEREALVEVWAYPQKGGKPRRIPATQLAALKKERREQPTFTTATYRDSATAVPATYRIEFNFKAAS